MPNKGRRASTERAAYKSRAGTNPRSRWGCVTCKAKHTKCDETRPECLRCTRSGIKCGGYWRQFKWSFKHQPGVTDPPSPDSFTVITTTPGSLKSGQGEHQDGRPDERKFERGQNGRRKSQARRRESVPEPTVEAAPENIAPEYAAPESAVDDQPSPCSRVSPLLLSPPSEGHDVPLVNDHSWSPSSEPLTATSVTTVEEEMPLPAGEDVIMASYDDDGYDNDGNDFAGKELVHTPLFTTTFTDTSSLLISTWFEHVCPVWNGFDSGSNLNRKLAVDFWQDSLSVFSSLQSMSAAFLSTRLPHMRQPALRLLQTATESILNEVRLVKSGARPDVVPTGLLFSLFGLGTTVCWVDAGQLGLPFLREAKFLLDQLNRQSLLPIGGRDREKDADILSFFNRSLTYCEMLLAVVSDTDPLTEPPDEMLPARPAPAGGCGSGNGNGIDGRVHPWTGVSTLTSHLFARCVRLCRSYRRQMRHHSGGERALRQIREAERLEERLLELEFPQELPAGASQQDTGDQRTPLLHLARVAEAYQLASLLHLYQTFPDLVTLRLPSQYLSVSLSPLAAAAAPWSEWIVPLSFRLVRVLEQIPPYSGSRVIQPLLYISASTGLRYVAAATAAADSAADAPDMSSQTGGPSDFAADAAAGLTDPMARSLWDDFGISAALDVGGGEGSEGAGEDEGVSPLVGLSLMSRTSLDVSNARHFIMMRLAMLENTLPPNPVIVARELVKAVWDAYDAEMLRGSTSVHWVDVMEDRNLRSMFG